MNYNKNLINALFDIKEKLEEKDKQVVERFIEQYNKMYAECRMILEEKDNTRKVYNENARLKKQIESYKQKIIDLENKIWEENLWLERI